MNGLSEEGLLEAQELIAAFRAELIKAATLAAEEAIGSLYGDILPHIESDSWCNFRQQIIDGLSDYKLVRGNWNFKKIRQAIFTEYREELIADLNQDMLEEIADLKKQLIEADQRLLDARRY